MTSFIKGVDRLNKWVLYLIGILLLVMSVIIAYQVFSRFFLKTSLSWSEESARYLMAWLVFLGTAVALRKQALIGVEAVADAVSPSMRRILKSLVYLVCLAFGLFLFLKGIDMLDVVKNQKSPAMRISMTWVYAAVPVGGLLMALNSFVVFLELQRKDESTS